MADEIATLEKNVEDRLSDRVAEIRNQLRSRCLKGEISEEIVKRPIDQLVSLLNVINDPSELQISEKIRAIDAQTGLLERRLDLLKDIEHLKTAFKAEDLQNAARMEGKLDELIGEFTGIHEEAATVVEQRVQELEDARAK
ncbi:hypothetical protein M3Y99_00347800 [Aphelenchoides fujianensis]|nr:hypothetical protein M3Y99_00347800 [Aphelenchoides fujianensis]